MKEIKSFFKGTKGKVLLFVFVIIAGFLIRENLEKVYEDRQQTAQSGAVTVYDGEGRVGRELDYAQQVSEEHPTLQVFGEAYPEADVVVAYEEDITNDGNKDMVIVFETMEDDEHSGETHLGEHKHVRLTVAIDSGDGENYKFTEPIPAPVENQKIKFQDIDKKEEIEFILQGQKDNKVGYAIYRVMEGAVVNLFGEGMEEC